MRFLCLLLMMIAAPLSSPSVQAETAVPAHPEARPFDAAADAGAAVDAALARARVADKKVILVMGANWCHDSRGLAGWFAEPRFAAMLDAKYELVYVDVGYKDRNLDIARRFGMEEIRGTPTVLVLSSRGELLNPRSAPKWRNAASRDEDDIFVYFDRFTPEL
tara:strand:- start:31058 stop:31546 length:489 start_codon:yes stop_codon:yes gene_type:complete